MGESFSAVNLIKTKRDGGILNERQIRWMIDSYTNDVVADEQLAALLMAIVWRGLNSDELDAWTDAMIDSGTRLDMSSIQRPTVGKHSTGGVGDKVSIVVAPMVAACGVAVPKLSGRALGHTGGTLDKLEAIPGFRSNLAPDEMLDIVRNVGCVVCAAGGDLAPADRKIYGLRDVTGTVESIPLLASSIMSKKIAEGTGALVLDVKVGSGAFLPDIDLARELARTMVDLGSDHDVPTTALLTDMDAPLGQAAGNGLEVTEALEVLKGGGPDDLVEVTLAVAKVMLELADVDADPARTLRDGTALERFEAMVKEQGGDPSAELDTAAHKHTVDSERSGFVQRVDARSVGVAAWRLGAGRARKEDDVSATAGVLTLKKPTEEVSEGEAVFELHYDDPARLDPALQAIRDAVEVGSEPPEPRPLIMERIDP